MGSSLPSIPRDEAAEAAYLARLGTRVRSWRQEHGLARKALALASGVSERYLAQLEGGRGNVSILLLRQIAAAMAVPLAELVREGPEPPVELRLIEQQLGRLDATELAEVQGWLRDRFGRPQARRGRIALIGLRGAGKTTLGHLLAARLDMEFVQLDELVAAEAGMSLAEVFDLFGQAGYRRLERRCLDRLVERAPRVVIEAGGGVVAEAATFERLLAACFTVWLRARPEDHMRRVAAQGDHRPMAGSREAMADLRRILDGREALYAKADAVLDTTDRDPDSCADELLRISRIAL